MDHEERDGRRGQVSSIELIFTGLNQDGLAIGNLFRAHFAAVYKWAEANLSFVMNVLQVIHLTGLIISLPTFFCRFMFFTPSLSCLRQYCPACSSRKKRVRGMDGLSTEKGFGLTKSSVLFTKHGLCGHCATTSCISLCPCLLYMLLRLRLLFQS